MNNKTIKIGETEFTLPFQSFNEYIQDAQENDIGKGNNYNLDAKGKAELAEIIAKALNEYFDRLQKKRAEVVKLEAENKCLKQAEKSLLDAISDWYYLSPNPQADETLAKQYENFLTFGQGGANFAEAQELDKETL